MVQWRGGQKRPLSGLPLQGVLQKVAVLVRCQKEQISEREMVDKWSELGVLLSFLLAAEYAHRLSAGAP